MCGSFKASMFLDGLNLAGRGRDIKKFRYDGAHAMQTLPVIQCCAPLGGQPLDDDEAAQLELVFKALADRHRVKILNCLVGAGSDAVCVCDFEELLGLKQPTVSYHLKQLLTAGIIRREKRGSYAHYSLEPDALERIRGLLELPAVAAAA
jgi:ArsR family transcriptional regulator, arsenate/arsenite/antimonite-responsive transcriptional repressor